MRYPQPEMLVKCVFLGRSCGEGYKTSSKRLSQGYPQAGNTHNTFSSNVLRKSLWWCGWFIHKKPIVYKKGYYKGLENATGAE
jgi:hypothetical protein